MGLDMYLKRHSYCCPTEEMKSNGGLTLRGSTTEIKVNAAKLSRIVIEEDVTYWRKVNQIHNWFDSQIENGIDNCKEYFYSFDKLIELREACKQVLANNELAEELLPTCEGFFFGETDYDEYYFDELNNTVQTIDELEKEEKQHEKGHFIYSYCAWW